MHLPAWHPLTLISVRPLHTHTLSLSLSHTHTHTHTQTHTRPRPQVKECFCLDFDLHAYMAATKGEDAAREHWVRESLLSEGAVRKDGTVSALGGVTLNQSRKETVALQGALRGERGLGGDGGL